MTDYVPISQAIVLQLHGADAERYLHNRLTNNIKALGIGRAARAAALSPQGKTQGVFTVVKRGRDDFLLWCDGGASEEVAAALLRFKVADRIAAADLSADQTVIHLYAGLGFALLGEGELAPGEVREGEWGLAVRTHRSEHPGVDLVVRRGDLPKLIERCRALGACEITEEERTVRRIQGGAPEFPHEITESTLFAEAEPREAVSFTKGCYVGQEVLERIDSHGALPFRFVRIELSAGSVPPRRTPIVIERSSDSPDPDGVGDGEHQRAGEVVSAARESDSGAVWCFGRLRGEIALPCRVCVDGRSGTARALWGTAK